MRRGQLLSLDALVALVVVIFILSAVTTTSQNLRSGLSSMLGWYERTNIADNMLDVLVNSPGEPSNWNENLTLVRVPGLRSTNGQFIDYNKLETLFKGALSNNTQLINALWNLSGGNNFELEVSYMNYSLLANYTISQVAYYSPEVSTFECILPSGTYPGDVSVNCTSTVWLSGVNVSIGGNLCVLNSLIVTGTTYLTVNGSLYVTGSFRWSGSKTGYIGSNLYVNGTWKLTGSGDLYIGGNVYVFVQPGDWAVYMTGNKNYTVGGVLYISYGDTWYAVIGTLEKGVSTGTWYVWENGTWQEIPSVFVQWVGTALYVYSQKIIRITATTPLVIEGTRLEPPLPSFPEPPCLVSVVGSPAVLLNITVSNITVEYKLPVLRGGYSQKFAVINKTLVTDASVINASKARSSWIEFSEARVPVSKLVYSKDYNVTPTEIPLELYSGTISQGFVDSILVALPPTNGNLTFISAFTTPNYVGYSIMVVIENNSNVTYGVKMIIPQENISEIPRDCTVNVDGNDVVIPLTCFIPQPGVGEKITFSIWLYSMGGFPSVEIEDTGNFNLQMQPIYQMTVLKLWVWR